MKILTALHLVPKQAIADLVGSANSYQYNIPCLQSFKKELADYYGVHPDHILVTLRAR